MRKLFITAALLLATTSAYAGNAISIEMDGKQIRIEAPSDCDSLSCLRITAPGFSGTGFGGFKSGNDNDDDNDTPRSKWSRPNYDQPRARYNASSDYDRPRSRYNSSSDYDKPRSKYNSSSDYDAPRSKYNSSNDDAPRSNENASNYDAPRYGSRRQRYNSAPAADQNAAPSAPAAQDQTPPQATVATTAPAANDAAPPAPATAAAAPAPVAAAPAPAPAPTGPLGVWAAEDNKGNVRIEECGANLCGYAEKTGEKILINMRPDGSKWTGRIHDPDSGKNYDSTIAMKGTNSLRVQGCAFGGMFCGGQTWKRVS